MLASEASTYEGSDSCSMEGAASDLGDDMLLTQARVFEALISCLGGEREVLLPRTPMLRYAPSHEVRL